jgi:hypothetical protein
MPGSNTQSLPPKVAAAFRWQFAPQWSPPPKAFRWQFAPQ